MSKQWKPGRQTVELTAPRPSRIRREPVRAQAPKPVKAGRVDWRSAEWEIRMALIGIVLFALAIDIIWVGISAYTGH